MHLLIPDPTPDEPAVPEPSVCPTCEGEATVVFMDYWAGHQLAVGPCDGCCCATCGQPTETPPLCARCDVAQDAAYERGQDR